MADSTDSDRLPAIGELGLDVAEVAVNAKYTQSAHFETSKMWEHRAFMVDWTKRAMLGLSTLGATITARGLYTAKRVASTTSAVSVGALVATVLLEAYSASTEPQQKAEKHKAAALKYDQHYNAAQIVFNRLLVDISHEPSRSSAPATKDLAQEVRSIRTAYERTGAESPRTNNASYLIACDKLNKENFEEPYDDFKKLCRGGARR